MFSTHPIDWALVAGYFGFLAVVWVRRRGRRLAAVDYLLAGRRITLPALVATLVATWYGGILGVGEYGYRHGISNWLVFGVPYYVGALLFALLVARRARAAALVTIPDLLARRAGRGPALYGALMVFVASAPAAYVLALGTLFAAMLGLPLAPCVAAAALLSVFYVERGGLPAVVLTDKVQVALMFGGFALLLGFLVARHGGLDFLAPRLPATHLTWHGGNPAGSIFVWYVIALGTLVDPAFWQRAYAARDPATARRAVLWSIVFWVVFDAMTTASGLYARVLLPALADPVFAFPELARATLPPGALGVFYLGLIATVMSTIDSYAFIAALTVGRDLIGRLRGEAAEEPDARHARLGLWVTAGFAAALALLHPSVVGLWHGLGSVTTPALLVPVGTALLRRGELPGPWTLAAMALASGVALAWLLAPRAAGGPGGYPWGIEPIYAGLASSLLVYAAGWSRRGTLAWKEASPA